MKKRHGYFMQDDAATHMTNYHINVLDEVFGNKVISHRLWP
jgi:hypothetical protein